MFGTHQFIDRRTGQVRTESFLSDGFIDLLYNPVRENMPTLYKALTGPRFSRWLAWWNYDLCPAYRITAGRKAIERMGADPAECLDAPESFKTMRQVFERRIRFWECRPLSENPAEVAAPADSRMLQGCLARQSLFFIKEKFFSFEELLGADKRTWLDAFEGGPYAVFRLTPDKYHFNHAPVTGKVLDYYAVEGAYHSCNPGTVVHAVNPLSKNRREVTVIDTDVPGGSGAGLVGMVEIVALMIGEILQCYSEKRYDNSRPVVPGMRIERGCVKSLFRPGSSSVVLLFQKGRFEFSPDLTANQRRTGIASRFAENFESPLIETEVMVRSTIGCARRKSEG